AQAVLGVHRPHAVRLAVATRDLAALTAVPGIGRKGAERLVLELKDRIGTVGDVSAAAGTDGTAAGSPWREQVSQALVGLGWSAREAELATAAVASDAGDPDSAAGADIGALLKAALLQLGRS
ncbi:MAG: helix-hairpin-helix domain-containing protein, partial [Mycobacteriales bacterium]